MTIASAKQLAYNYIHSGEFQDFINHVLDSEDDALYYESEKLVINHFLPLPRMGGKLATSPNRKDFKKFNLYFKSMKNNAISFYFKSDKDNWVIGDLTRVATQNLKPAYNWMWGNTGSLYSDEIPQSPEHLKALIEDTEKLFFFVYEIYAEVQAQITKKTVKAIVYSS